MATILNRLGKRKANVTGAPGKDITNHPGTNTTAPTKRLSAFARLGKHPSHEAGVSAGAHPKIQLKKKSPLTNRGVSAWKNTVKNTVSIRTTPVRPRRIAGHTMKHPSAHRIVASFSRRSKGRPRNVTMAHKVSRQRLRGFVQKLTTAQIQQVFNEINWSSPDCIKIKTRESLADHLCSNLNSNLQIELESIKSNTSGFEGNLSQKPGRRFSEQSHHLHEADMLSQMEEGSCSNVTLTEFITSINEAQDVHGGELALTIRTSKTEDEQSFTTV